MHPFNIFLFFSLIFIIILCFILFLICPIQGQSSSKCLEQNGKIPQKEPKNTPKTSQGPKVHNLWSIYRTAKGVVHHQGHGIRHGSWDMKSGTEAKTLIFFIFFTFFLLPNPTTFYLKLYLQPHSLT